MTEPVPFDAPSLLPHRGHARFVSEVVEYGDDKLVCIGRIPVESPFAHAGKVPGYVLMELAAQAAAIEMLSSTDGKGPRANIGYVVRARALNWTAEGVSAGTALTASVRREGSMPPLYTYRATVTVDGAEVFGGSFSIYVEHEVD